MDIHNDGGHTVNPTRHAGILHVVDYLAHITQADRRAVLRGDDDVAELRRGEDLVVGVDGIGLARSIEAAFGGIDIVLIQRHAHVFQAEALAGEGGRVNANPDGGFLIALDGDEADAGHFAELLREDSVRQVVNLLEWQGIRADSQREDWRVSGVDFAVDRRVGHFRQDAVGRVHRRLHILGGGINVPIEYEL